MALPFPIDPYSNKRKTAALLQAENWIIRAVKRCAQRSGQDELSGNIRILPHELPFSAEHHYHD
jgi:hypothetical protein